MTAALPEAPVAPVAPDFGSRIAANSGVTTFFPESMFDGPVTLDGKAGSGLVGPIDLAKSHSFPDPWHDASSFLGVTNPEGILQWDDARMSVPAAWATTLGDKTVKVAAFVVVGLKTAVSSTAKRKNRARENIFAVPTALPEEGPFPPAAMAGIRAVADCRCDEGHKDQNGHRRFHHRPPTIMTHGQRIRSRCRRIIAALFFEAADAGPKDNCQE